MIVLHSYWSTVQFAHVKHGRHLSAQIPSLCPVNERVIDFLTCSHWWIDKRLTTRGNRVNATGYSYGSVSWAVMPLPWLGICRYDHAYECHHPSLAFIGLHLPLECKVDTDQTLMLGDAVYSNESACLDVTLIRHVHNESICQTSCPPYLDLSQKRSITSEPGSDHQPPYLIIKPSQQQQQHPGPSPVSFISSIITWAPALYLPRPLTKYPIWASVAYTLICPV